MNRTSTGRDMLRRSTTMIQVIHQGLLTWSRNVLEDAQMQEVEVYGQFPPDGSTRPFLTIFPYSMASAPALTSTARPSSLLHVHRGPGRPDLPRPWGALGSWIAQGLLWSWPPDLRPHAPPLRSTVPLDEVPGELGAWYRQRPDWQTDRGGVPHARLASFWWYPGLELRYDYVITGGGGSRGTLARDREPSAVLLGALSALAAAGHHEGGFDVAPPWPAVKGELVPFCEVLAQTLEDAPPPVPPDHVRGVVAGLRDAAAKLGRPVDLAVAVVPTNDLGTSEMFSLMQALGKSLQAASCFKIQCTLAEIVEFAPSSEVQLDVFPRFRFDASGLEIP